MQAIDLATVKAAKATDRRSLAILAYDNATADPVGANWRGVADMLRLALPAVKAKPAAEIAATDSRFAPWSEHDIPVFGHAKKFGKSPILVVTFADGETVRAPAVSLPGKPVNVGRALRVAFAYYRGRIAHRCGAFSETAGCVTVPDIVSVICETTAAEYHPADCNARTAELRAGAFDYAAVFDAAFQAHATAGGDNPVDVAHYEYRKAVRAARRLDAPVEYTDDDRHDLCDWIKPRPAVETAIRDGAGCIWITEERPARLAWAVMTFWPDLADSELTEPTEIARPLDMKPAPPSCPAEPDSHAAACDCPACSSPFVARHASAPPCEAAPPAVVPVAPAFKVPSRFLASSRLVPVAPSLPVAPSCILVAA